MSRARATVERFKDWSDWSDESRATNDGSLSACPQRIDPEQSHATGQHGQRQRGDHQPAPGELGEADKADVLPGPSGDRQHEENRQQQPQPKQHQLATPP